MCGDVEGRLYEYRRELCSRETNEEESAVERGGRVEAVEEKFMQKGEE